MSPGRPTCCQRNIMTNVKFGQAPPNPCSLCGKRWRAAWPCQSTTVHRFKNGDVRIIDISLGEEYIERKDIFLWYLDAVIWHPR